MSVRLVQRREPGTVPYPYEIKCTECSTSELIDPSLLLKESEWVYGSLGWDEDPPIKEGDDFYEEYKTLYSCPHWAPIREELEAEYLLTHSGNHD